MAFELPTLPFPKDSTGTPYIASPDASGKYTVASGQWFKNASNLWVPVSATDPLPTVDNDVKALLTSIQGYVDGLEAALGEVSASPTAYTVLSRLKDLADRLGEVSATPTANTMLARLKTLEGYLDGVEAALGTQTDAEATGNGSLIAIIKRLRTLVGQGIVTLGSAIGTTGLLMAGSDGTNARAIKTASDGTVLTQLTGRLTAITHSVLTVTTTSQQVLAANPDRKYAMLINDSDTVIYIKIGAPAVVGEGIRLNPNGGSYEMSSAIGNLHTGAINAIHGGTGTKNLLIAEGV